MTKKQVLAGAVIAGMMTAASIAYAPVNLKEFSLAKTMPIVLENALEKMARETDKKLDNLLEDARLAETDEIYGAILMSYNQLNSNSVIPPYITKKFLREIVRLESSDFPKAVGADGERGLTQITKGAWYEVSNENFEKNAFNPRKNITASIKYFLLIDNFWRRNFPNYSLLKDDFSKINSPSWEELPNAEKIRTLVASYNGGKENFWVVNRDISKMRPVTIAYVRNINRVMDSILSEI